MSEYIHQVIAFFPFGFLFSQYWNIFLDSIWQNKTTNLIYCVIETNSCFYLKKENCTVSFDFEWKKTKSSSTIEIWNISVNLIDSEND